MTMRDLSRRRLLEHLITLSVAFFCFSRSTASESSNSAIKTLRLTVELSAQLETFEAVEKFAKENRFAVWKEETRGDGVYWVYQLFRLDMFIVMVNAIDKKVFELSVYETCRHSLTSVDPVVLLDSLADKLVSIPGVNLGFR